MNVLLLCAGYGTRFIRDLDNAPDKAEYQLLRGVPKPLLPVSGLPLISHWTKALTKGQNQIESVCAVVNNLYYSKFEAWKLENDDCTIDLIADGTTCNEDRLGAVACIQLALDRCLGTDSDLLIIAGDTLFGMDFKLNDFVSHFRHINKDHEPRSLLVDCECSAEEVSKRGILEVSQDQVGRRVTSFLEKPNPQTTSSRRQCPCLYLIHKEHLTLINQFLALHESDSLEAKDATGNFIKFLIHEAQVYSFETKTRYDIGSLESYLSCCQQFDHQH